MDVIEGYCAIRLEKGWKGVAAINQYSEYVRQTPEEALEDARKIGTNVPLVPNNI